MTASPLLPLAVALIMPALAWYSVDVWVERSRRELRWGHAGCFAAGLMGDGSGTLVMTRIAAVGRSTF